MVLMCIYLPFLGARKYSSFSTEGLTKGPTEGLAEDSQHSISTR